MRLPADRRLALTLLCCLCLCLGAPAAVPADGGAQPRPAQRGLTPQGRLQLHGDDTCPVCAMRPAKHAKFAAAIELTDGRTYYFCSNGCMIRAWLHPREFLAAAPAQRRRPVVQAFFSGRPVDARQATWVAGSEVMGPMGPAMVALETPEMAAAFRQRHGGKYTFKLDEMTDALWEQIKGRKALW